MIDNIDRLVGQRVRQRRLMRSMSQQALAKALGITFQQVQKYEIGKNRISAGRLKRIADVLGVDVGYFFPRGEGAADDPFDPVAAMGQSRFGIRIAAAFLAMDLNRQRVLTEVAEAFADIPEPGTEGQ